MSLMIKRLEVKGYKSLKDVVWEPGRLNVIIGPNGSGKSNLLRLLETLSSGLKEPLDKFINHEGGMGVISWDGRAEPISIGLEANHVDPESKIDTRYKYSLQILYEKKWNRISIDHEVLETIDVNNIPVTLFKRGLDKAEYLNESGTVSTGTGIVERLELLLSRFVNSDRGDSLIQEFADYISNYGLFYSPDTGYDSHLREPNMTRYENSLFPNGQNLITFLHTQCEENSNFNDEIHSAMRAAFGATFDSIQFPPAADQYIQMRIRWKPLQWPQPAAVLSDGILKFLYVTSIFANPNLPTFIAVDEPETGFHPSLFRIIAELAGQAAEKTQVAITTHSPEFLTALQEVNPEINVTVMEWDNGETKCKNLTGEKLKRWLDHYRLGELFLAGDLEAIE